MKKFKNIKPNTLLLALIVTVTLSVVILNAIILVLSGTYLMSFDLTTNSIYEIGEHTGSILNGLTQDVYIYILASEEEFSGTQYLMQARRMIEQYPKRSPYVTLEYIDYASDPAFAARYPGEALSQGDMIVESGSRVRKIALSSLFHYISNSDGSVRVVSSRAEEALTSAIVYVTGAKQYKIAVLGGNGAHTSMPALFELLGDNHYEVSPINIVTDVLSSEYDAAILIYPEKDLSEAELAKLDAYLYNAGEYGKTLIYTADARQPKLNNLESFLMEWGIEFYEGAVFETSAKKTYQEQPFFIISEYAESQYRSMLADVSMPVAMSASRPISLRFSRKDSRLTQILLTFSETSAVRPTDAGEDFNASMAVMHGPFPAAVLSSVQVLSGTGQAQSNILVLASTAMLEEFTLQNPSLANSEYFINVLNVLVGREDTIAIPPKSFAGNALSVPTSEIRIFGTLLLGVIPFCILAAGIVIWLFRRNK